VEKIRLLPNLPVFDDIFGHPELQLSSDMLLKLETFRNKVYPEIERQV